MEDTISAIATALGVGAVGIIRVSGPESLRLVNRIFRAKEPLSSSRPHSLSHCKGPGVRQTDRPHGWRRRLSVQALFLFRIERPCEGPAAPLLRLPGKGPGRSFGPG